MSPMTSAPSSSLPIPDRAAALSLDAQDGLAERRQAFLLPEGILLVGGNSLGALPVSVPARVIADHEPVIVADLP